MDNEQDVADANTPEDRVLHVRWSPFDQVAHLVSPATISAADDADNAPYLTDFGDLRRSGDVNELQDRLERNCDGAVENYVAAIELSAGRTPAADDLAVRLKALDDVDFDGDDEFPSDATDFRPEWEIEEAPAEEWRGYNVIAKAMSDDVPKDIFNEFAADSYGDSPVFSGHIDSHVDADRLEAMIAALEARGYVIIRD
jgi:hypothetical protein